MVVLISSIMDANGRTREHICVNEQLEQAAMMIHALGGDDWRHHARAACSLPA